MKSWIPCTKYYLGDGYFARYANNRIIFSFEDGYTPKLMSDLVYVEVDGCVAGAVDAACQKKQRRPCGGDESAVDKGFRKIKYYLGLTATSLCELLTLCCTSPNDLEIASTPLMRLLVTKPPLA